MCGGKLDESVSKIWGTCQRLFNKHHQLTMKRVISPMCQYKNTFIYNDALSHMLLGSTQMFS